MATSFFISFFGQALGRCPALFTVATATADGETGSGTGAREGNVCRVREKTKGIEE
jgi:hypothetical protein